MARLAIVLLLTAAAVTQGAGLAMADSTLYVDGSNPGCSNSGAGTASQPFCSISAAAAAVTAGQSVQVAAGTYTENVGITHSGTSAAPIVFTAAPGATVTLSGQASGFTLSSVSWVTVAGFTVTNTSTYGIVATNSSNMTLSGNHVSHAGQPISGSVRAGIRLSGVTNSLVSGNISDHNSDYGIILSGGSGNEVRGNQTFNNAEGYQRAAAGIRLYQSPGNVVDRNISHDNEDSGIESYTGSNNTLLYDNVTYNNGDHGIDDYQTTGQRIIANTVYKNVTAGINVEGSSTGATISDNISVDNGINSPRTSSNIRVETGSTSGTTMDSDLVYLSQPGTVLIWNSVSYSSLSSFRSATGQESHGLQNDPLWKSPAAGDFHLTAGSPAIDSADSGVSGWPSTDAEGHARIDDPATPNTGLGTIPYADRGAYEYQPGDSPPTAALSLNPSSGTVPLPVSADASGSTDTDGTPIATYSFDFGDGSGSIGPQAGPTAGHTYNAPGTYTVTVTVTDTAGFASTATAKVTVLAVNDVAPNASLSLTPTAGNAPLPVSADASGSTDTDGTPIATYSFDFGDGSGTVGPQAGPTANHTYSSAGTYTVKVTVTDTVGLASTATAQVTVSPPDAPPNASLSLTPTAGNAPLPVSADASGSTDTDATPIATYSFDFGDGSGTVGPQAGATANHTYIVPGTYTVKVTVTDSAGLSSTATKRVAVNFVGNFGFETGLSGWDTAGSGAGVTLTQVAGGHSGSWSARVKNTSSRNATYLLNDSPNWVTTTATGKYTASLWVRSQTPGARLTLRLREMVGASVVGSATSQVKLTGSWQNVTVAYTTTRPGTSSLDFSAYVMNGASGTSFDADDAAIYLG